MYGDFIAIFKRVQFYMFRSHFVTKLKDGTRAKYEDIIFTSRGITAPQVFIL